MHIYDKINILLIYRMMINGYIVLLVNVNIILDSSFLTYWIVLT